MCTRISVRVLTFNFFVLNVTFSSANDRTHFHVNIGFRAGRTNIADALNAMHTQMYTDQNGDRFEAPNVCILITDGTPTVNEERTLPEAIAARVAGTLSYPITGRAAETYTVGRHRCTTS